MTIQDDGEQEGRRRAKRCGRAKAWLVRGAFSFLAILNSVVAHAGGWPTEFTGSLYFYSTDPTPITVTLRNPNDPNVEHKTVLHVPRAAIVFANDYDAAKLSGLPDKIETDDIVLALTYPDGKPLILHAKELAAEKKISLYEAIKDLRLQEYAAQLGYTSPDNPWEARVLDDQVTHTIADTYEGMPHAPGEYYFGKRGSDEFVRVHCYSEAVPSYFCKMGMRVSPSLIAWADFADFRFHGGRRYLNERARKLRDAVCRYIDPPCTKTDGRKQ
jgi:hypothetical protein